MTFGVKSNFFNFFQRSSYWKVSLKKKRLILFKINLDFWIHTCDFPEVFFKVDPLMDNFQYFPKRTKWDLPRDTLEIYGFFYQLLFRFLGIIKVLQKFTMLAWNYDNAISVFPCQSQEISCIRGGKVSISITTDSIYNSQYYSLGSTSTDYFYSVLIIYIIFYYKLNIPRLCKAWKNVSINHGENKEKIVCIFW